MTSTGKRTFGGRMERLLEVEQQAIQRDQLLSRLWAQDTTLWPHSDFGAAHIRENLQFLHFPEALPQLMAGGLSANQDAEQEGMTERVLISFGSVHHFCKAVLDVHPEGKHIPFRFLESCHPYALRTVEKGLDPRRMLVIFVNKSSYRLEDHSLFLHFCKKLAGVPPQEAGKHFAAAADPDSYLAMISGEYHFRYLLRMPAGIQAPYCSLLFLGLFLIAVAGVDSEVVRSACREMKKKYMDASPAADNLACDLAAFLAATAKSGRRIVKLLASPALTSFAAGLCPLLGGSLGRSDYGLFPLASKPSCAGEREEKKTSYILLGKNSGEEPEFEDCKRRFIAQGTPLCEVTVENPLDLARLTFGFQLASILCASRLGIYPFETPDALKAQSLAGEILSGYKPGQNTFERRPRVQEGPLQLFAEGRARQEISQLNAIESLRSFFQKRDATSYVSLFVFLEQQEEKEEFFERLRVAIEQRVGLPVLLAWGPRSMDTYSHLLRQEAPAGLHLVITGEIQTDVKVPGANYAFGQLYFALALGQFEALSRANGLALRLHVGAASSHELAALENVIHQALRRIGG